MAVVSHGKLGQKEQRAKKEPDPDVSYLAGHAFYSPEAK
jgi:hypothetical protein